MPLFSDDGKEYESEAHLVLGEHVKDEAPISDPFEAAATRQKASVKPLEGRTEGLATKVPEALVENAVRQIGTPAAIAKPNPYPKGSEEADYYDSVTQDASNKWGPEMAVNLFGMGTPFAQAGSVGIFGGRMSKAAVLSAETLEKRGVSEAAVKEITGLERGADGMWRKEFSDKDSSFKLRKLEGDGEGRLGEYLDHPELYSAYPKAKDIQVVIKDLGPETRGEYINVEGGRIHLSNRDEHMKDSEAVKEVLIHELQHYVQQQEGFDFGVPHYLDEVHQDMVKGHFISKYGREGIERVARLEHGGNPEEARRIANKIFDEADFRIYQSLMNETEARNAAARSKMSKSDIRKSLGKDTEDVPRKEQIGADYHGIEHKFGSKY